jgi:hypothetical protein
MSRFCGTSELEIGSDSGTESRNMSARWIWRLIVLAYIVIGCVIAWDHGYLGLAWLRAVASAVLAILLWWLIPLGVNLHIHG